MKLVLAAIGKAGRGPEAQLAQDYADRATVAGRPLGLGPLELLDLEPRKPGKAAEAELILKAAEGGRLIACDERGRGLPSREFAGLIGGWRDAGDRKLVLCIGGADGLDETVRHAADRLIAFGPQTWPHALARAMLAEQVYRAVSILGGSPYHRD
jgi:Uncharacterized conserved protein